MFIVVILIIFIFLGNKSPEEEQDNSMVLKLIYTFLIGIFLAVFVGVGIAAFYPGPKYPEPPLAIKFGSPEVNKNCEPSAETKAEMEKFDKEEKAYQEQEKIYNRNASVAALVASIIIVVASLTLFREILLIADGLLLGGVLTLIYSVLLGFGTEDNMFRFIVVSVGLFTSLFLGYVKFIKPAKNARTKKK